jgi:hypothetical protein
MTTTTLTFSNRDLAGEYNETALDHIKKEARFRLTSISGKYYNFFDSKEIKNIEIVGKRAFDKFTKENNYVADF